MSTIVCETVRLMVTPHTIECAEPGEVVARVFCEDMDGWALGHAFDGVLWGFVRAGALVMAGDDLGERPRLRAETLMDLRVFGADRELRMWRAGEMLRACEVRESTDPEAREFAARQDQSYLLLGSSHPAEASGNFVELIGRAGQRHTPPVLASAPPRRIHVRHYFQQDDEGLLRVAERRLVRLSEAEVIQ